MLFLWCIVVLSLGYRLYKKVHFPQILFKIMGKKK